MKQLSTIVKAFVYFAVVGMYSCGSNTPKVTIPNRFKSEKIVASKNKLQQLLTKEMVSELVGIPTEKIQENLRRDLSHGGQLTLFYSWPTGDEKNVGTKFTIAEYQSIGIGFIDQMTLVDFERRYGSIEGLQAQVDRLTSQKNFNKEIATIEARKLAAYAKERTVEELDQIATLSYWEKPANALHVLAKDAAFTITTNFKDEDVAKEKAIELASEIINR